MYKIADLQIPGRYVCDGELFNSKEECADYLIEYHSIDFSGTDDKDNELEIWEYLEFWKIKTAKEKLDWVLEYGQWEIEKIKKKGD